MTDFIAEVIRQGGYVGIFALMALENIFPPIPSEIIMGFGGVLVARGDMAFWPLLIVGTLGTTAGNLFWYWLGRRWSEEQLRAFIARYGRWLTFEWREFTRARAFFLLYGDWIVFVLRFSPILRTIVSLPAGLAKMGLVRFCVLTFLGSLIWNGLLIVLGDALSTYLDAYEQVASFLIIAAIVLGCAWYVRRVIAWKPDNEDASDGDESAD
jgi:membrane protein DedA with SNARE-associated domain